jgi:hypothetical protein
MKDTWGKVYHQKLAKGWDNGCAAFAADMAEKRATKRTDIHVMPADDKHESDPSCWCAPEQDHIEPNVWIHREMQ